ncbi:hypothetical protein KKY53_17935 [Pseudomonas aeruginosa]|uniref:hypothetical protein n=1 Tax=Pseudomonas aeruginosa TaxID=287 RepID=UPI00053D6420|nr:hypothetical protein [Pseudomonas aeruginosa]WCV76559.1 hypothetical protein KKY53_17935 [Pseudomonas aeruginosa]HBO0859837.1 hypothetical protein [Pseudomonas aeruginosa]HBO1240793.1 hypothetical protein [Pseudomonas aeruginosa]HBO1879795.1 hypothetical protein [Pseudomonas aeruginosa]HBO2080797.1 hypothetical protein [Pseudomonas aeruginosa]
MNPITRFQVRAGRDAASRYEFVRETKAYYVRADGTRIAKRADWYRFYATEQEAQSAIERDNRKRAERAARRRVESYGPELLIALEQAYCALVGYLPQHRNAITTAAIEAARSAIDKAKGGASA